METSRCSTVCHLDPPDLQLHGWVSQRLRPCSQQRTDHSSERLLRLNALHHMMMMIHARNAMIESFVTRMPACSFGHFCVGRVKRCQPALLKYVSVEICAIDLPFNSLRELLCHRRHLDYFSHCHIKAVTSVDSDLGNGELCVTLPPEVIPIVQGLYHCVISQC